jgi:2-keto-4-pentenoate hydratase
MQRLMDGSDAKLTKGTGNTVLGSPLNVATWISRDLAVSGTRLKAGDLISVGSFSPLTPQATADGEGSDTWDFPRTQPCP